MSPKSKKIPNQPKGADLPKMMTTYNFMLTVSMGKRLIAKGLMNDEYIRDIMMNHRLLIMSGTTNGYVAEEALKAIGDETPFDKRTFRRGITVAPGAKPIPGSTTFDLLIDHGKAYFDRTVFEIAPELGPDDMIMKGANALYLSETAEDEAGVLIGHPQGGTLIPITAARIGRRVQLMVPIGVEKRVQKPIAELVSLGNASPGEGPRLAPIPGTPYTELNALYGLTDCLFVEILASGGAMGAEGGVYFTVRDEEEKIEKVKALVDELKDEPPTQL